MSVASVEPLVHPGPIPPERVVCIATHVVEHSAELPAGAALLDALSGVLAETGAAGAVGRLVGGGLDAFDYFIPDVGPPGGPVATFSAPYLGAGPGELDLGGLTLGQRDGEVFAHSHALFRTGSGAVRAGHLIPESVILGEGVTARLALTHHVVYDVSPDPETTMSLFVPRRVDSAGSGDRPSRRALVCRVRPNVDLPTVIEELVAEQGWASALVQGQIGSLVGGRLGQEDGSVVAVDGPATEVMYLDGAVTRRGDQVCADLSAGLVDRHGEIHRGALLKGLNPVAMTYELTLVEG